MSERPARLAFTSVRPDGTTHHYALAPPGQLARAFDADPIGVGRGLLQQDERTVHIQARATALWGRWYEDRLEVPLHRWWRHFPGVDEF